MNPPDRSERSSLLIRQVAGLLLRLRFQKEVSFPLKRFLCVVLVAALMVFCAACGRNLLANEPEATAAPTASSSRNVRSEPVKVTETYANADNVTDSQQATETPSAAAPSEAVDTPETGDFPVVYFAGVLGLILICSAGLLMLRRI